MPAEAPPAASSEEQIALAGASECKAWMSLLVDKEKERRIKLHSMLDKGENFERATYAAA